MADLVQRCKQCGWKFVLTADDREWFVKKGFELPKRCFECRAANKRKKLEGK